jgi:hypothetical protein
MFDDGFVVGTTYGIFEGNYVGEFVGLLLGLREGNFHGGIYLGSVGNKLGSGQFRTQNFAVTVRSQAKQ